MGRLRAGAGGLVAPEDPHALLLPHPCRDLLDAAEEAAGGAHRRPSEDPPGRPERAGPVVARRPRSDVRREDPVREDVVGLGRAGRPQVHDPRRHARLGRRGPVGRSRPTAVRHLRRDGRPGLRPRSRRGVASGIRVRLRVPRVRPDRVRRIAAWSDSRSSSRSRRTSAGWGRCRAAGRPPRCGPRPWPLGRSPRTRSSGTGCGATATVISSMAPATRSTSGGTRRAGPTATDGWPRWSAPAGKSSRIRDR